MANLVSGLRGDFNHIRPGRTKVGRDFWGLDVVLNQNKSDGRPFGSCKSVVDHSSHFGYRTPFNLCDTLSAYKLMMIIRDNYDDEMFEKCQHVVGRT